MSTEAGMILFFIIWGSPIFIVCGLIVATIMGVFDGGMGPPSPKPKPVPPFKNTTKS